MCSLFFLSFLARYASLYSLAHHVVALCVVRLGFVVAAVAAAAAAIPVRHVSSISIPLRPLTALSCSALLCVWLLQRPIDLQPLIGIRPSSPSSLHQLVDDQDSTFRTVPFLTLWVQQRDSTTSSSSPSYSLAPIVVVVVVVYHIFLRLLLFISSSSRDRLTVTLSTTADGINNSSTQK